MQGTTGDANHQGPMEGGLLATQASNQLQSNKELLDQAFLQNFYFLPAPTLNHNPSQSVSSMCKLSSLFHDEPLIPLEQIIQIIDKRNAMNLDISKDSTQIIPNNTGSFISEQVVMVFSGSVQATPVATNSKN